MNYYIHSKTGVQVNKLALALARCYNPLMEVEKRKREIVATLTREDVFALQAGETIFGENKEHGDRPAVTMSDANFEIAPLSELEPDDSLKDKWEDDRLEKAAEAQSKAHLYSNGDVKIFVPAITLSDCRLGSIKIPRKSIETLETKNGKKLVKHVIPTDGIVLNLGGSLKVVNIPSYFA
jgi:hypothetical protein